MKHWMVFFTACCAAFLAATAQGGEYLLAVTRPNTLHLVDLAARKVARSFPLPGEGVPAALAVPADGKVAYVLTGHNESVVGIDLDSGKQVFGANLSSGDERVKSMYAMTVSLDGSRLYVHQIPTRIKRYEYESLPTRIAVYDTAQGLDAQPLMTFPAPRRITLLAPGANRDRLVAMGFDFYVFDVRSGKIDKTFPMRNWKRAGFGEPDVLSIWQQYEQTRVLAGPYFVPDTAADPASPEALKLGILRFDLDAEKLSYAEVANADAAVFSSVVNPAKRDEVFTVMNQVYRADMAQNKFTQRVELDQTYYAINISGDGKEVYLGGALDKIAVYDAATLTKQAEIVLPGGDQAMTSIRVIRR